MKKTILISIEAICPESEDTQLDEYIEEIINSFKSQIDYELNYSKNNPIYTDYDVGHPVDLKIKLMDVVRRKGEINEQS